MMFVASLADVTSLPHPITLVDKHFFILGSDGRYWLASRICPHQGGLIHNDAENGCLRCPLHNWEFAPSTGKGTNTADSLTLLPLEMRDNSLWLNGDELPDAQTTTTTAKKRTLTDLGKVPNLSIRLLAHASLDVSTDDEQVLVDPWLDGPAMLGAWRQYPRTQISGRDLKPSAVIITHEHSDHFHLPTLKHFNRKTPIYVPAFGNGRIEYFLRKFGFRNIVSVSFGAKERLSRRVALTFFRPTSIFNDSIALLMVDGYKILNLNDAGLNRKIADQIGPVDLVSCIFSTGASGYPMTWTHLTEEEKHRIMDRACAGRRDMLVEAIGVYRANYLLPFASYFKLWQPEHREYLAAMRTNTLSDVVAHFNSHGLGDRVIDLLPGETWNPRGNQFIRTWADRSTIFAPEVISQALRDDFAAHGEDVRLDDFWGTQDYDVTRSDAATYFKSLNKNPDIRYCENVILRLRCFSDDWAEEVFRLDMTIIDSHLIVDPSGPFPTSLPVFQLDVPRRILKPILFENLSWDEARVG